MDDIKALDEQNPSNNNQNSLKSETAMQVQELTQLLGADSVEFISHRPQKEVKLRFINTSIDVDENDVICGVIELIMDDCPFIVDSIRIALNAKGVIIEQLNNEVIRVARDAQGHLQCPGQTDSHQLDGAIFESFIRIKMDSQALGHIEVEEALAAEGEEGTERVAEAIVSPSDLLDDLREIMGELSELVTDYQSMLAVNNALQDQIKQRLQVLRQEALKEHPVEGRESKLESVLEYQEAIDFLVWLASEHFIFLGSKSYRYQRMGDGLTGSEDGDSGTTSKGCFEPIEGSELGLLRVSDYYDSLETFNCLLSVDHQLLFFAKSATKSRHHRAVYPDIIMIRKFDASGHLVGETRLMGLFTSRVFNANAHQMPYIRRKVAYILKLSGFPDKGHSYKEVVQLLETYPREELFQADKDELLHHVMSLMKHQEQRDLQLSIRQDPFDRFISALVFFPRDDLSTSVRKRLQSILQDAFNAVEVDFSILLQESSFVRLHFTLRLNPNDVTHYDLVALKQRLVEAARNWERSFYISASEAFGELKGRRLTKHFAHAFPIAYREAFSNLKALEDAVYLDKIENDQSLEIHFYQCASDEDDSFRIKLYYKKRERTLSDIVPMLENFGLLVLRARHYPLSLSHEASMHIDEFEVKIAASQHQANIDSNHNLLLNQFQDKFRAALMAVWSGDMDSDPLNQLVIAAHLEWRKVILLRAYASYLKQIQFSFSLQFISEVLLKNSAITAQLIELFEHLFNPDRCGEQPEADAESEAMSEAAAAIIESIKEAINQVTSLDEDRLLSQYLHLIQATLRTNAYVLPTPSYLSLKLSPSLIPTIPKPVPKFEIYLYSPLVEGVHLRGGKVARGGLRWSDRKEDYRTEILGLVKAQQVKNSVIVPVGAKGGFVIKKTPANLSREAWFEYGRSCYKLFIRGILDITDNILDNEVVTPDRVVRRDEQDPYMVIAADKGTATFSDTANAVAEEYQFWLGDGFASGGSVGYDHKKMGITARGAWVSVQHLFRELGVNVQTDPITTVGIGDMSGDVFGNGMLQSESIRLVAAFNHLHIFVDPNPDLKASFVERQRLFDLPRSGWDDYNSELISKGGGIFLRSAKQIPITAEMKKIFCIQKNTLTPTELMTAILKAPVDLLWNGGIGTYIKASTESHSDVGDKANDDLRINGDELGAKAVGEGGNLGLTQLGRIEYSQAGGLCNTDFIDNAGGVACSDQEVNIKILLNGLVAQGQLTTHERNELLAEMTDLVAEKVLNGNSRQVQAISLILCQSVKRMSEYRRYIQRLESSGRLDRRLEFIPTDDQMLVRMNADEGLTRPELAVLLAYSKSLLKEQLVNESFVNDPLVTRQIEKTLPKTLFIRFKTALLDHKLKNELVATGVANRMVNRMGITFTRRMEDSTGASVFEIAKSWLVVHELFDIERRWRTIESLNYEIAAEIQQEMFLDIVRLMRVCTRWILRNFKGFAETTTLLNQIDSSVDKVSELLPELLRGARLDLFLKKKSHYHASGVSEELAIEMAGVVNLRLALSMIHVAIATERPLGDVLNAYLLIEEHLQLFWFAEEVDKLKVLNHWQALTRESLRDDIEAHHRSLVVGVLSLPVEAGQDQVDVWLASRSHEIERWNALVEEIKTTVGREYPIFSVALRELFDLADSVT